MCGDTLFSLAQFSLAHQGREFLPGKFSSIDWLTNSGGGRTSAICCRMPANKSRETMANYLRALMSFSLRIVSDKSLILSDVASVRAKLRML